MGAAGLTEFASPRRPSIARSAGIISGAVMISRILGLVREMIFAYFFGASKSFAYDAYVIAFRIPNMLRALFAEGALSAAFVTVFSDYLVTKAKDRSLRLSNITATALVIVLGVVVVVGMVFAPAIVAALAPGYAAAGQSAVSEPGEARGRKVALGANFLPGVTHA